MKGGRYWSLHTHTRLSKDDALSQVDPLFDRAVELGYPALATTDHGNMSVVVEAYQKAKQVGMPYAPGLEIYVTPHHAEREQRSMHLTLAAYTGQGYRNLVALHNQAQSQFYFRPRVDLADLAAAAENGKTAGIALATGCRSGPVVRALTERGSLEAEQVVKALAGWFPRVYVELMDHGFKADGMADREIVDELIYIAEKLGLPTILTGDAHYVDKADKDAHDALKTLVSFSSDPDEGKFSGEGYWLLDHNELDPFQHGFEGLDDLAAAIKVKIPELDTFKLKIPDVTLRDSAREDLMAVVTDRALMESSEVKERIGAEDEVITSTGMWPYLALVHMITDWMEEEGIWYYARGSVAGSRVCYDLRISSTDPVAWDIRMDRFLSGDRTSIPDIDLDIEHGRRRELLAMLEGKGYELVQVCTKPNYGLKKAEGDEDGELGSKGSLLVKYFSTLRKQGDDSTTWDDVPQADKRMLYDLADRKLSAGFGVHPGGLIVARSKVDVQALPLVTIGSSGTTVTCFDKDEVEAMGFPKIDLLGSKVLTAVKQASMAITGLDTKGARDWYRALPLDDVDAIKRVGAGKTVGLFQLGGWTNAKVCAEIQPKKTADIVAVQALGRPAPMKSGFTDEFIARRRKKKPVPEMHADIAEETKATYGLAIYQEQVVGMLRRMGVQPAQLTRILKAVKSSGKAGEAKAKVIIAEEIQSITDMATARGWGPDDLAYLERCLIDYGAGYSFGKAHSVTYGVVAYNTAFLATHHSLEFWTGMLNAYMGSKNSKGESLEPMYVRGARDDGIRVKDPHVNRSGVGYTMDAERNEILRGLVSVTHVGVAAAEELIDKRPFESLQDLFQRVGGKVGGAKQLWTVPAEQFNDWCEAHPKSVITALQDAGALSGLPYGAPIRKAVGRIRKCKVCKHTYDTPLDYEDHLEAKGGECDGTPEESS